MTLLLILPFAGLLYILMVDFKRDRRITQKLDDLRAIRENATAMYEMGNRDAGMQFEQDYMKLFDEVDREVSGGLFNKLK